MNIKRKNKHGRVGVKRLMPTQDKAIQEARSRAFVDGYNTGQEDAFREALHTAVKTRTIKECRAALQELLNASA